MSEPLYNIKDKKSIISYAEKLKEQTLRKLCEPSPELTARIGKGYFGQSLEQFYFKYAPNSDKHPDFNEVKMELKSSPLKKIKGDKLVAKERVVLSIIDYCELIDQEFPTSSFFAKNASILFVFYLWERGADYWDYIIKLIGEWRLAGIDLEIIKSDWLKIQDKVNRGLAHELSEGDTLYLGACTKGADRKSTRKQPKSEILAKQRAFSFKQGYVNHIIASLSANQNLDYGRLISSPQELRSKTLEEIVIDRFTPFLGKDITAILKELKLKINLDAKNFYSLLSKAILGVSLEKEIEEFDKAEIRVRAIRVEKNDKIIESVSFNSFDYFDLVEEEWDDSSVKSTVGGKFFFLFFKARGNSRYLHSVKFWNMPPKDLEEVERVYNITKELVKSGNIVSSINSKGIRKTNFPDKKGSYVAHVRPHAKNAKDTKPLPFADKLTGSLEYTKHCFWLNNDYVKENIYLCV